MHVHTLADTYIYFDRNLWVRVTFCKSSAESARSPRDTIRKRIVSGNRNVCDARIDLDVGATRARSRRGGNKSTKEYTHNIYTHVDIGFCIILCN